MRGKTSEKSHPTKTSEKSHLQKHEGKNVGTEMGGGSKHGKESLLNEKRSISNKKNLNLRREKGSG